MRLENKVALITGAAHGALAEDRCFVLPLGYQPRHPHQVVRRRHQLPSQLPSRPSNSSDMRSSAAAARLMILSG